jgi:hypothetical protein
MTGADIWAAVHEQNIDTTSNSRRKDIDKACRKSAAAGVLRLRRLC